MTLATRSISTPNKGPRTVPQISYIVLHHMAGTSFEAVLKSWSTGAKQGSCNYAISNEGAIVEVVPEKLRSWSLSSAVWDSAAITFEIENESAGGSWPVSAAATLATARVVADLCDRYGIPATRDRIIGHREVYTRHGAGYPTACPGGLDLDGIVAAAGAILSGNAAAAPAYASAPVAAAPAGWIYWEPNGTGVAARVQAALKNRGRYNGRVDDEFGPLTRIGVQLTLKVSGDFDGLLDGVIEGGGCRGIQTYAERFGDYTGGVDSRLGINSWRGFALGLERP